MQSNTEIPKTKLPDVQNADIGIIGIAHPIQKVGISGIQIPLNIIDSHLDQACNVQASVSCSASVPAFQRALHMSRFVRILHEARKTITSLESLEAIILNYQRALSSNTCQLQVTFDYPIIQSSLLSNLQGFHFYPVAFEGIVDTGGQFHKLLSLKFTYSSACPCSSALAQHSLHTKYRYSIPHSQRSVARIRALIKPDSTVSIHQLKTLCAEALHTEVQIMVRREDEQRFAELNGLHVKFVEDAVRQLYTKLDHESAIEAFDIQCRHSESLHPYDAIAEMAKGTFPFIPASF